MRVELLCNLKASKSWEKGTVFDDTDSPIPVDVMAEVKAGADTVRVIDVAENPNAISEDDNENKEPEFLTSSGLSELEGLIEIYGSKSQTAKYLGVTAQTVTRWLNGGIPDSLMVSKVKAVYEKANEQG
jgi:hypothetical protein